MNRMLNAKKKKKMIAYGFQPVKKKKKKKSSRKFSISYTFYSCETGYLGSKELFMLLYMPF